VSEHVHEWGEIYEVLTADGRRIKAWCKDYKQCDGVLQEKEIVRRLNATERLGARDARLILGGISKALMGNVGMALILEDYAAALEGEDE